MIDENVMREARVLELWYRNYTVYQICKETGESSAFVYQVINSEEDRWDDPEEDEVDLKWEPVFDE